MEEFMQKWLFDPVVGKPVTAALALAILIALVRILQRSAGRYIRDSTTRYRTRKGTKNRLFSRILEEVDRSGDKVRIATASFELLSAPDLAVHLRRARQ